MRRVVITGIGLVTALGIGTEATWQGLIEGRTGIGTITLFDASTLRTQLAGEVVGFTPQAFITNRRTLRLMTRGDQLACAGATLAMQDSQLNMDKLDGDRVGLFVGGNKELCDVEVVMEAFIAARDENGIADIHRFAKAAQATAYPLFFVLGLPAASLFYIGNTFGIRGPNAFFVGTADASAVAVGSAYRAIRSGEVNAALTGGFDDPVAWWMMTKLDAMQVMSDQNGLGAAAYKPYDRQRTGTLIGEGAAFLVLEEYEAAVSRGAQIYAEITGFGNGNDAYRLITPHPQGRGLAQAMRTALREANTSPDAIQYIAAHGSGTRLGDATETQAIRTLFGSAADRVAASSVKPATGHLVAASGAFNTAIAALALQHQILPPTLNLQAPDSDCNLDWVAGHARPAHVHEALALARGMEGQNVALALRRV